MAGIEVDVQSFSLTITASEVDFDADSGLYHYTLETPLRLSTRSCEWRVGLVDVLIPGARYFRAPRIAGDWVVVKSPQISSAVLSFPASLGVFPVTTVTSQLVTHQSPPNPIFYPLNTTQLNVFSFSLTNSQSRSVRFIAGAPPFVITLSFKTFLYSSQIDGTNNVAFISGPITSLFQDAELTIGGVVVEGLNQASSWTGFLKSTLGLSPAAAKSWGRDALKVLPDAPGQSQSQLGANNPGFAQRKLLTADSAYTSVLGPLSFDVSSSGLAVPGSTSIRITLTHRPNSERLVSSDAGADYILTFERLEVIATYLSISESALLALRHKQAAGSLTLNFLRTSFTGPNLVPSGVREHTFTISRGRVPELVLIGLAPTVFTESAYDRNFLCFNDCGVNFLQCMVAGRLFPAAPLTPDFATGADTMPIFLSFLECAKLYNDQEISITFDRWRNGCCIFPVQLRVHMPSLAYQNPPLEGDLICRIKFSAATTENINIFVYGVSPARIGISPQNTVQLIDFAGS